ncbi:copper resistance CopC family protein [Georgenia sp. M64]|uniref:copper resistance CopC family protein n=1 Tax=Georgenia sp. M64 TaxID=3120520 RepID=UPI0030DED7DE
MIRAVLAVVAALVLATAPAATAHDVLLESSPADGARLASSPREITLTFSADLLATGAAMAVSDDAAATVAEAPAEVDGRVAAVSLEEELPAGGYTVTWSVVSSDGHRIDGDLTFTVEGPAEGTGSAGSAGTATDAADPAGEGTDVRAAAPADPDASADGADVSAKVGNGGDGGGNDPGGDQVNNPTGGLDVPGWVVLVLAIGALGGAVAIAVRRWRG